MPTKSVTLWYIYHVKNCIHTKPQPKDKFIVITCISDTAMGFLINSHINDFILNRPHLSVCQAAIDAKDHTCLNHNSYIDCRDIFPFAEDELNDPKSIISPVAKRRIIQAVYLCTVLEKKYKNIILSNEKDILDSIINQK